VSQTSDDSIFAKRTRLASVNVLAIIVKQVVKFTKDVTVTSKCM